MEVYDDTLVDLDDIDVVVVGDKRIVVLVGHSTGHVVVTFANIVDLDVGAEVVVDIDI